MKYIVSTPAPHSHYIDIEFVVDNVSGDTLDVQLPAWRPGRYQLANFAKNIQEWAAFDAAGNALPFSKQTKDLWRVETNGSGAVHVKYNYYANELNAGSTYLDEDQLYVNPVNCFLYVPEREGEACQIELKVAADYKIACGMESTGDHTMAAADFQEVADSPFIASNSLQHRDFTQSGVLFHLWFQGEVKPDWDRIERDFRGYTEAQLNAFGDFPVKEYHYFFQIAPYKLFHGVEHCNSTVISLGPSYDVMGEKLYDEFLGVSSHELYHTWNIKCIRPNEMSPYDFSKENYSRLGYVAEGVTTYMGDLMLKRGGVWDTPRYFKEFSKVFQRHLDNFGRFNLSVADSSFDTWLDGYVAGVPNRKVSIYTEGSMLSFMIDVMTINATQGAGSLHSIMRVLYERFAKAGKGYSESDYQTAIEQVSGLDFSAFFTDFVWGTKSYESSLMACLDLVGCTLQRKPSPKVSESQFGLKVAESSDGAKVIAIHPDSPAAAAFCIGDVVVAINGYAINSDLNQWLDYFKGVEVRLNFQRAGKLRKVTIKRVGEKVWYERFQVAENKDKSAAQQRNFKAWVAQ
jgi:predicted metalloprotease with PDZ domain